LKTRTSPSALGVVVLENQDRPPWIHLAPPSRSLAREGEEHRGLGDAKATRSGCGWVTAREVPSSSSVSEAAVSCDGTETGRS
jgi:hypothetical protein